MLKIKCFLGWLTSHFLLFNIYRKRSSCHLKILIFGLQTSKREKRGPWKNRTVNSLLWDYEHGLYGPGPAGGLHRAAGLQMRRPWVWPRRWMSGHMCWTSIRTSLPKFDKEVRNGLAGLHSFWRSPLGLLGENLRPCFCQPPEATSSSCRQKCTISPSPTPNNTCYYCHAFPSDFSPLASLMRILVITLGPYR